jgi:hypothetical protein
MATEAILRKDAQLPRNSQARLWFGLAATAVAWVGLGFSDILITWRACVHREQYGGAAYLPAVHIVYMVVAVFLFAVAVTAGATSYRNWRALSHGSSFLKAEATDREEFMALLGVIVSVTLGMGIVWLSLPPLLIELYARVR